MHIFSSLYFLQVSKLNALGRKPLLFLGNPGRKGKSVGDLIHFIPTDNVLVKIGGKIILVKDTYWTQLLAPL